MTQAQTNSSRIGYPNLANLQQSSNFNQSADSNDRSFAEVFDELALQTTSRFSSQDTQPPVQADQSTRQDRVSQGSVSQDRLSQDRAADHAFENSDQNTIADFQTQQPIQQGVQIRQLRFRADQKFLPGSYIQPVVPQQNANNRASVIAFPEQSIVVPDFSATEAVINTTGQLNPAPTLDQIKNAVDPLSTINDAKQLSLGKTPTNDIDEAIQSLIATHRKTAGNAKPNQTVTLIRPTDSELDQVTRTDPLKGETIKFDAPFPVLKYPLGQSGLQPVNEKGKAAKAFDLTASETRLARLKDHHPSTANKVSPTKPGQFTLPTSLREGIPQSKLKLNPTEIVDSGLPSEAGIENAVTLLQSIVATLVGSQNIAAVDNTVAGQFEDPSNSTTSNINPAAVNTVQSHSQQTSGQTTDFEATGSYRPGTLQSDDQTNYHRLLLDRIAQAFESRQQGSAPVRFRLNVPKLGMIDIDIQISQSNISAAISAESSVTRQLVSDNLPELRQRLSQQGLNQDSLNIRVVTPADNESAADDSGGQSGQQFPKSPRLPRVARDNDLFSFSQQLEQVDLDVINVHV